MSILQSKTGARHQDGTSSRTGVAGSVILEPGAFVNALCRERRRAERSHRRFALMLIEFVSASGTNPLESAIHALSHSTRETDIRGWYKERSVIGVIFTELGSADVRAAGQVLLTRINDALGSTLSICQMRDIRLSLHVFPEEPENGEPPRPLNLAIYPDIVQEMRNHRMFRFLKRTIDIAGSSIALILFSPLMLLIAVIIKLTSEGPVLFRQRRLEQFGRTFGFLKFRSMYSENDRSVHEQYVRRLISGAIATGAPSGTQDTVYKLTHDPRITPFGRILRRTSLDELPQFINVLKGEMSIIGPRPPIPYEFVSYDAWHNERLAVKPGITGLWQVQGRSRTTFAEMVRLDLKYARSWSLWLDIKILLQTPWAVLSGKGAY